MMDEKVMVYIDNSNIFNETQKFSARKKRFLGGVIDVNCRVDVGKLVRVAVHRQSRRRIIHGKLYGSEPPALDTVWKAIREKRIQVYHTKRSLHNHREKQTDTGLVNAATEDLIEKIGVAGDYRSVILFTGDSDMMPVVRTALRKGWKVELWSYDSAMAGCFKEEARLNELVNTFKIDDYFDQVTFSVVKWPGQIPEDRAMVLKFQKDIAIDPKSDRMTKEQVDILRDVIYKAIHIFQLPFTGKFLQNANENSTRELALVPNCPQSKTKSDDEKVTFYDFNDHIWDAQRRAWFEDECDCKVMTFIEYLDQKKDIDFDGIIEGDVTGETKPEVAAIANNPLDHIDNSVADDFKLVLHKKTKKSQIYSDYCRYGFNCTNGMKCSHAHREVEKEFFKEHPTINRRVYKAKPCQYHLLRRCKYDREAKSYLCPYVHSDDERRCLVCKTQGLHWTDECDIPREEKGLREYDRTAK